jgi:hypothetical protein
VNIKVEFRIANQIFDYGSARVTFFKMINKSGRRDHSLEALAEFGFGLVESHWATLRSNPNALESFFYLSAIPTSGKIGACEETTQF